MEKPYYKINGVDILKYIEEGGLTWQRNDVESAKAGRTMDAAMHRGRVAVKIRWDVACRYLKTEDANIIMQLILPEFVTVETNMDPLYGTTIKTYYSNNIPATCMTVDPETGAAMWEGITFPLIEQ